MSMFPSKLCRKPNTTVLIASAESIQRRCCELGELHEMALVLFRELRIVVFVGELQQPIVVLVLSNQGDGQPSTHGRMLRRLYPKPSPCRLCTGSHLVFIREALLIPIGYRQDR